jgi:polyhydroxybutyrate depolymerase
MFRLRRDIRLVAALLLAGCLVVPALAVAPAPAQRASAPPCGSRAGFFPLSITSGGRQRTALLQVPRRAVGHRAPLVVVLHGAHRSGPFMPRYSGIDHVAGAGGFIAVYPSALGSPSMWNLGAAGGQRPDDVGFVRDLVDLLQAGGCADPAHTYAVGVSNGGGLAARLACEASDRFAGVVVVAGGIGHLPPCRPDRPVSVLEIHGTDDRVVPYDGRPGDDAPGGVAAWVAAWAQRDRCGARAGGRPIAPGAIRYDYAGCADGAAVAHIVIVHGQHAWPGATPPDPGPATTVSAALEAWRFLRSHVLAPPPPGTTSPAGSRS